MMHFQKDTREIAELLKAKGMASLDLSLPIVIVVEEPTLAKSIGEIDVLSVYNMINRRYFASIDLAGLEKYRFRHNKRGTVKAVTANRKVKLMDTSGRMVFITNPNVFFPIVTYRKKTMSNLASFHGFKKLPPEIRHRIWTIAAEPRQLVAIEYMFRRWSGRQIGWVQDHGLSVKVINPSVTEACAEARTVLVELGMYKVIRYEDRYHRVVNYFIFNPETDTLEIDTMLPSLRLAPQFTLAGAAMNPAYASDLAVITHLTLPFNHLRYFTQWAARTMDGMLSLRQLFLWETRIDRGLARPHRLFLEFVPFWPDFTQLLPIFGLPDRELHKGIGAIMLLGELMGHQIDDIRERLLLAWNRVNTGYQSSRYFPARVRLDLSFWPEDEGLWGPPEVFINGA